MRGARRMEGTTLRSSNGLFHPDTGGSVVRSTPSDTRLRALLPMLIDIGAPIIVYFILHSLGVGDVLALTIGGMVTAINALVGTVRRRLLDSIGLLVVAEIALSIALLLITQDPRILLIKPSFYVGFAAIYTFATCLVGRPIGYESGKPFATKGDPNNTLTYNTFLRGVRDEGAKMEVLRAGVLMYWGGVRADA
jgi:hypothetical protein